MPSFHRKRYQQVERTYEELARYAAALSLIGPTHIVPALPLPTPAMIHMPRGAHDGDVYELHELRQMLARWFDRVTFEPVLRMHRETLHFIESDYSYTPQALDLAAPSGQRRQAARSDAYIQSLAHVFSGALFAPHEEPTRPVVSLFSPRAAGASSETPAALVPVYLANASPIGVSDPDEQLAMARSEVTRLEQQLGDVAHASTEVERARRRVHAALDGVATKFAPLATLEESRAASLRGRLPRLLRSAQTMFSNVAALSEDLVRFPPASLTPGKCRAGDAERRDGV